LKKKSEKIAVKNTKLVFRKYFGIMRKEFTKIDNNRNYV
jgi:hypothetical protein